MSKQVVLAGLLAGLAGPTAGCNSILNAWLDPSVVGAFDRNRTMEIRASLSLEDTPSGICGAEYPLPEDLMLKRCEYPISAGDTLFIEINELRQREVPYQVQAQVASGGYVNLPVLGRVYADGLTVMEFEEALVAQLREGDILLEPEVTVNPLFLQRATYSIFGIGVSAANDAPLRAGVFPIRRPDLRVLEAINQVGGLNEYVTDVYVFRTEEPCAPLPEPGPPVGRRPSAAPADSAEEPEQPGPPEDRSDAVGPGVRDDGPSSRAAAEGLFDDVLGEKEPAEPEPEPDRDSREIIDSLEADPTQPYLWDNVTQEFVPNPEYTGPARVAETPSPPTFEATTPAVDWSRIAGESTYRIIRIPADSLRSGDPEVNVIVRAGDVIRILSGEIGVYYVMGQVNRVGAFAFNTEQITIKAAIAAAGGLSSLAWPDRCTVYRRIGRREQMIQVNLDRIFAGKDPDVLIRRGDIINVGTHPFAPFLQRIREFTLPSPQSTVGYSFRYARNFADIDSYAVRQNPANEVKKFPDLFP